jgi:uncharacterized protein
MKTVRAKKRTVRAGLESPRLTTALPIPSILLEGDNPPPPSPAQPVQCFALKPLLPPKQSKPSNSPEPARDFAPPPPAKVEPNPALPAPPPKVEFPEAYGTQRLLLVARDPHWLYANWDLTRSQLEHFNRLSGQGHLMLRIYQDTGTSPCKELPVHPESRNWFVQVEQAGCTYRADLGYYSQGGSWVTISASSPVATPAEGLSDDLSVRFQTLSPELPSTEMSRLAARIAQQSPSWLTTLQHLQTPEAVGLRTMAEPPKTGNEQALGELLKYDETRRVRADSLEITELIKQIFSKEKPKPASAPQPVAAWSAEVPNISSPAPLPGPKKFWFNVNAELVIYGGTEPDAKVTFGGRPIQLRPDGTFSFRFALPDGYYSLAAQATSADATDSRAVVLKFSRETDYQGEVGQHPQAAELKPPPSKK